MKFYKMIVKTLMQELYFIVIFQNQLLGFQKELHLLTNYFFEKKL